MVSHDLIVQLVQLGGQGADTALVSPGGTFEFQVRIARLGGQTLQEEFIDVRNFNPRSVFD